MLDIEYQRAIVFLGKLVEYADDINAILRDVANHYDADRAYVFEISEDRKTLDNTYEWCKVGIEPQIDILQNLPYESVAVWVDEFERSGAFYINSLDRDVEVNSLTYEILEPQGIESLITAPIYREKTIVGFIGVDNPRQHIDDIIILKATATIIYSEIRRKIVNTIQKINKLSAQNMQQDAQLGEIREIVASANMGIWRIELVENQLPRMYADDTMKRLLGIQGQERNPEKTYTDWYSNILPEAIPSVLDSIGQMEKGLFDENTYLWNHPSKGPRYVRCGGTAKLIPGGYSYQGYHYDVDEVVRRDQMRVQKLKKAIDDKKEYYDTLSALGDIYYSLHLIDLDNDTVTVYNAKDIVKEITSLKIPATEMMLNIINSVISDEWLQAALDFTDLTTLSHRMRGKKIITTEIVGVNIGWFIASFITVEQHKDKTPSKVIFATRCIDEEKRQEERLVYQSYTDEMTGLLNRRAYEESIYQRNDSPSEDHFVYVSLDANGLKQINDTIGHEAGDELLIGIGQCMRKTLKPYGSLFRIGGDEFIAILLCGDEEAVKVLADFDREIENWSGKQIDTLSVSYGWTSKQEFPEASVRQLGTIAEKRMYAKKAEFYQNSGMDRRGQKQAHTALLKLYTKILKINISDDTYQIVNMQEAEQNKSMGFSEKISQWLISFGKTGQVHPDDLEKYLRMTDLQYIRDHFAEHQTPLRIFYRRKIADNFKHVLMELIPADDYQEANQTLYLYVKEIERNQGTVL